MMLGRGEGRFFPGFFNPLLIMEVWQLIIGSGIISIVAGWLTSRHLHNAQKERAEAETKEIYSRIYQNLINDLNKQLEESKKRYEEATREFETKLAEISTSAEELEALVKRLKKQVDELTKENKELKKKISS